MNEKVVVIGASGHGKVIADIILKSGDILVGFLDDNPELGNEFIGYPILGEVSDANRYVDYKYVIGIGNAGVRKQIADNLEVEWYTAIHPTAVISDIEVEIGEGTVIMANAVVNAGSKIEKHCIINTSAIVEHDNYIDEYAHVSVGVKLAGNVSIGKNAWIGIGSQVIQGIRIGHNTIVGAGATVIRDVLDGVTVAGCPARPLK